MTQLEAQKILKTGRNVFITGPAGSGKTFVVNEYIKYLREHDVPIGITASTGIAATHLGGMTIHSWSGMGIKNNIEDRELADIMERPPTVRRIREAQVLIIDEVSMLHHFRLDSLNSILKHVRRNNLPFGGLQMILCGDFFQLPPVSKYGEPDTHFIYRSEAWRDGKFTICYLHENFRQTDDSIINILNEIRGGEVSDEAREQLRERHVVRGFTSEVSPPRSDLCVRLFTHNTDIDKANDEELNKIDSSEFIYQMTSKGKKPLVDVLKKTCLAPEVLRLRKGARVMCVKNNFDKGYVNGTLGIVVSCGPGVAPVIRTPASRDYPSGRTITIDPAIWQINDGERVLAEISQYPLRLAWAITVHKSQGMSLDAIEVDLSKSFEPGMGYVALSRVRSLNGLTILGINENAFRVHPEVLEYDRHLRELSTKAESVIQYTDDKEILRAHNEFLAKVAPMYAMGGTSGGKSKRNKDGKLIKPPKISTFEKSRVLILAKKSLNEIAKERGLNAETIISHVEQLVTDKLLNIQDITYLKHEIPYKHLEKIGKVLEEVSAVNTKNKESRHPLLSVIKNKLEPNISFKEIRLARVLLGYF